MKKYRWHVKRCLLVALLMLGISGCYGDIREYCEKQINCLDGNKADEKACVETAKGERRAAKKYGCRDEYDVYMECQVDNGECVENDVFRDDGECDESSGDLDECVRENSERGYFDRFWWGR